MNTIANTVASKLFVAFVAAAMLFTLATPAKAATMEELQAQIAALMAQISSMSGSSATTGTAACTFTRALTVGSEGADVKCLQDALTPTYFNNAGGSTGYFGTVTASAVAAWQAANGVTPAVGYFGPASQAKFAAVMTTPTTPTTPGSDDSEDDSSSSDLSGEASLDAFEINDADDSDIEEGTEESEIAELDVEFTDGDAVITRLDIAVEKSSATPWDAFEEISLVVDGEVVATVDAADEDDYLDEDDGSLRFSGLDIVAMEDEEITITVVATVQNNLDAAELGDWEVFALAMRYVDADDVTTTEDTAFDLIGNTTAPFTGDPSASFTIEEEGSEDEVIVKSASNDPDATTLQLKDDKKSGFEHMFSFDIDTDDSTNDVEVTEITVAVAATEDGTLATSTSFLINDAKLVVDGEEYDDVTITHGTSGSFVFDIDGDLVIEAGDRVTVEFHAEFKALTSLFEGATVQGSVTGSTGVESEGADDITAEGSATGEKHTLRTEGAVISLTSVTETSQTNTDSTTADDEGVYTFKFEVTAFEGDLWVNKTAASGTTMGTAGVNYIVEDTNGTQVGTPGNGTSTAALSSTAETDGTRFKVNEGETETFTLTVEWDPSTGGFYQVQLHSFNFKTTSAGDPTTQQLTLPTEDYESDLISINN